MQEAWWAAALILAHKELSSKRQVPGVSCPADRELVSFKLRRRLSQNIRWEATKKDVCNLHTHVYTNTGTYTYVMLHAHTNTHTSLAK